jgi:hypothetical protein
VLDPVEGEETIVSDSTAMAMDCEETPPPDPEPVSEPAEAPVCAEATEEDQTGFFSADEEGGAAEDANNASTAPVSGAAATGDDAPSGGFSLGLGGRKGKPKKKDPKAARKIQRTKSNVSTGSAASEVAQHSQGRVRVEGREGRWVRV